MWRVNPGGIAQSFALYCQFPLNARRVFVPAGEITVCVIFRIPYSRSAKCRTHSCSEPITEEFFRFLGWIIPPRNVMSLPEAGNLISEARWCAAVDRHERRRPRSQPSLPSGRRAGRAAVTNLQLKCSPICQICCAVVAPPRPKEVPRPGTVLLCHIRAWLDTQTMPRPPVKSFLIR
jgi:hypothetical protein